MEFNGAPGGYSLLEWMADGERLVSSRRCFWEATWEAAPAYRSTADDSPEALALLAKAA